MERFKERQEDADSYKVKILGPIFILISIVFATIAIVYYIIYWKASKAERGRSYEMVNGHAALQRVISTVSRDSKE